MTVTAAQVPEPAALVDKAGAANDEVEAALVVDEGNADVVAASWLRGMNSYIESLQAPPHLVSPLASPTQAWSQPDAVELLVKVSLMKQAPPFSNPNNFRPAALPILAH